MVVVLDGTSLGSWFCNRPSGTYIGRLTRVSKAYGAKRKYGCLARAIFVTHCFQRLEDGLALDSWLEVEEFDLEKNRGLLRKDTNDEAGLNQAYEQRMIQK